MDTILQLREAAQLILKMLNAPPGAMSISSRVIEGETSIIVSLIPKYKYLSSELPSAVHGYKVRCNISDQATAH